ncbi:MAG: cell filamentation protein Fic [Alphaproteobacteria bacterium 41-28]|nr:MAG: cell filamentation protein Fic [Alphaproteobacteria bacterium 41-28]
MNYDKLTEKKNELDRYRPLPLALVRNLEEWFRVELTYTSNAIEGNTLTRQETALIVEKGITVGGKSLKEHLEAINHADAFDWVQTLIHQKVSSLTEHDLLQLHSLILKGIDEENAGSYRQVAVRISGSRVVLPNPLKVTELMADYFNWLQTTKNVHPVELAAEAHYRLVTIHPFVDGNGRTARLLMNLILLMNGYPPAIIRTRDRLSYIASLEKSQLGGSNDDYLTLISRAVDRSLDIYLKALKGEEEPFLLEEKTVRLLKIGELAKRSRETISTLRHWTKEGLLDVFEKTPSGYQLYKPEMLDRIRQIKGLKERRFTLSEIKAQLKQR